MREYDAQKKQPSRRHPIRNFFYLLYTVFNAVTFCSMFYALALGEKLWAVSMATAVAVALLFGVVNELFVKGS